MQSDRYRLLSSTLTLIFAALCCAPGYSQSASMFRNDPQHSGIYVGGVTALHGFKWKFHTMGEVNSSPAVVNGLVFFGSNDGSLYAVDAASGVRKWAFASKSRIPSSPAVVNGVVYFGSYDGNFYALSVETGKQIWKFGIPGERRFMGSHLHGSLPAGETMPDPFDVYLSSPTVAGGTVYFGSGDSNVYALDAATGMLKWKFHTGDVVHASPAISGSRLYIGSWDTYFYALDTTTGRLIWRFKTGEDKVIHNQEGIQSSAVVAQGLVYFGCRDSNFYALDADTGQEKWRFNNKGSWVITSPVVSDGQIYFATSDSAILHILNALNGTPVDSIAFQWPFFGSPSIAGTTLYLGGQDGKLLAIDLRSRKIAWTIQTDGSRANLAARSNADGSPNYEPAFASSFYDDIIVGVNRMHTVGMILTSPVISGDTVYFGSTDGNLYAVN
jgi:outer membrane protein assembly factor BamB